MYKIIQGPKVTWVDIQNPVQDDIDFLGQEYHIHPLVLEELIPPAWRVKVEAFPSYLFFVFYHATYSKEHRHTRPRELNVIVGKNILITSHYNSIIPLKALFDTCNLYEEQRRDVMSQTAGFLLFYVLDAMRQSSLVKLDRINKKLCHIEEQIFEGKERAMLREISYAKADIINFWRIVNPQGEILESLRKEGKTFFGEGLEPYFNRLLGDWSQCKNDLEACKETIESLESTNNGLLTDKTNEIVKVLTIVSASVLPLTLLAGLFGMNTEHTPLMGMPGDFWILVGFMVLGVVFLITYFKYKKWL